MSEEKGGIEFLTQANHFRFTKEVNIRIFSADRGMLLVDNDSAISLVEWKAFCEN